MTVYTFASFAERLALLEADLRLTELAIVETAAQMIEERAKNAIGTYEFGWPQLAESTQEERVREGYTANDPLKRTGHLKNSIGHYVQHEGIYNVVGYVGTDDPNGKYHELGTGRIPPRPFLGPATMQSEHEIHEMARRYVAAAISREGSEFLEVLHLAKEAAHHVKEAVEDFVDEPDEDRKKR